MVPELLGHPLAGRVSGNPAKPYQAPLELNEEQHVHTGECDCLDREEVAGKDPAAWERRSSPQVGPLRLGPGPKPCRRRMLRTEVADTFVPSLAHSPQIRR